MSLPPENLLGLETSPYLLQHKDNPVHWRPWSKDALDEARETGKPILLSVGYAACHWCHVMAHECFEDNEVATVMNRLFINIKVDREERPEIDQIYMAALAATGEQGGWPLTMFLTPDARPFWGGTYFPKQPRYGRPGFVQVMEQVAVALAQKADEVAKNANILIGHVKKRLAADAASIEPNLGQLGSLASGIANAVDRTAGGIGTAPKFPSAPLMEALWIDGLTTGNEEHRTLFVHSLREMLNGGIYDHLAGGLCRYATDSQWLVPHFEKMLYDNSYMIRHSIWAHAYSGEELFRDRIEQTVSWLAAEMQLPEGGFASSLDADSDGEEGKFYVWQLSEIQAALGADSDMFCNEYGVTGEGNWEGKNILHRRHAGASKPFVPESMAKLRDRLLAVRSRRIRPGRDDKLLADWNGLLIRALAEAGRYFANSEWIEMAAASYTSVTAYKKDGRLPHSIGNGRGLYPALLSDYAAMVLSAVSLFEATGNTAYIDDAKAWLGVLEKWYGDGDGSYFLTAADATDVPVRIRGDSDEAVTSATALTIEAVHKLALLTGDMDLMERSHTIAAAATGRVSSMQYGQAGIITAAALVLQPIKLVVHGDGRFVTVANRIPDPRRVDVMTAAGVTGGLTAMPDGSTARDTSSGATLCTGTTCLPPITEPQALEESLRKPVLP